MVTIEGGGSKYIRKAFQFADAAKKGSLTYGEFKIACISLFGRKPTKGEKEAIFGCDKSKRLTMKDFTNIILNKMKWDEREQQIHEAFMLIDCESKGFLVLEDLQKAKKNAFPHLCHRIIEKAFTAGDTNNDGRISYREFHTIMTNSFPHFI